MTWTQTILNLKDAAGANQPVIAYTDGTNFSFAHPLLDNTGAIIAPATAGLQTTGNTALSAIATSVAAIPASPATSGRQDTGNTSLGTIATNTTGVATAAKQDTGNTSLATIATAVQAATPAGANTIGNVGLVAGSAKVGIVTTDQTTHGTTDLVAADITKVAGSAISQGHGTAATAIRVELPTDGTGVVGLTASTNTIGALATSGRIVTGTTITRPTPDTNIYAAGDLVANSTTAATVNAAPCTIAAARGTDIVSVATRCQLKKTGTSLTNAIFRVHFYNAATTVSNGDNGAWLTPNANYLGFFDVTCTQAFTDGAIGVGIPGSGSMMTFAPATGTSNLYFLIEARAAYTPISAEVFTVSLEVN